MDEGGGGSTFSLVRYNNPVLIDKEEDPSPRAKSAPASTSAPDIRDETEEILDSILPPREWEEGGRLWRQSVSSTPATRYDQDDDRCGLDIDLSQAGCDELTGAAGPEAAAEAGQGDWDMSGKAQDVELVN